MSKEAAETVRYVMPPTSMAFFAVKSAVLSCVETANVTDCEGLWRAYDNPLSTDAQDVEIANDFKIS
jgi:hypothetical protein